LTVKGIHHVCLSVTDLDRSLAFYQAATSLEVAVGSRDEPGEVATLRGPNCSLELIEFPRARRPSVDMPVQGPGITHVCYQSATVDDVYGSFLAAGATPVSRGTEPVDLGGYGVYYAYARDPDGIMFEVEHLDRPEFEGDFWIAHVALASPDLDRLVDFYRTLLGIEPYRRSELIEGPQFDAVAGIDGVRLRAAWFGVGNMILELWQYLHPPPGGRAEPRGPERIGYNTIAFEVDDLVDEVHTRDPDGNLISLVRSS
jgi:catechol 2,3-dioxygenase-like lactoylglutathione lyase family enzyme